MYSIVRMVQTNALWQYEKVPATRPIFEVIRASIPRLNLDDAFEQKNKMLSMDLKRSAYVYEIIQTLIVDIEPAEHVKRAMNEINADRGPFSQVEEAEGVEAITRLE
ncbi:hypothetical protein OROMI_006633 [Orobanche minor]